MWLYFLSEGEKPNNWKKSTICCIITNAVLPNVFVFVGFHSHPSLSFPLGPCCCFFPVPAGLLPNFFPTHCCMYHWHHSQAKQPSRAVQCRLAILCRIFYWALFGMSAAINRQLKVEHVGVPHLWAWSPQLPAISVASSFKPIVGYATEKQDRLLITPFLTGSRFRLFLA